MLKREQTIGARLSKVVVIAVLAGILISVSFFLLGEFRQTVLAEQARLRSSAAAFAAAAAPAVRAGDERATLLVLRGIREMPELHYVAALDSGNRIVAEIGHATMLEGRDGALDETSLLSTLAAESLSVATDIRDNGEVIGKLTLTSGISSLRQRYLGALSTSVLFCLALMALTSLIARAQIARIIRPLGALAGEFADIGKRSDLTRRLKNDRNDEIGVLIGAFNEMFSHIERRDGLLQRHRDTLEQTVEERTAELRVAKEDAERANEAKSDFLATMSHEIRTPMNGMMVMAEMLSAAALSPKHLRYAEIISRSGRGLLNIINDILDFSKIEAGMMNLEAIPFSLDSIVEDAASLFAERAREKGLVIALFVAPDLPAKLIGDPTRLGQVIGNLLNNALKFTEKGGVTVEVLRSGKAVKEDSASIEVRVRDTGIGIAADKIERIFERFSQADQTITRKFGGTGLGLSISRKLVQAMGGELAVSSQPGEGSDFFFTIDLPVAEAAGEHTKLEGRRVRVCAASPLAAASVEKALVARGATLSAGRTGEADAVLVEAGCDVSELAGTPVILMRQFAGGGAPPQGVTVAGEISLPLGRAEAEAFAQALCKGDWHALRARDLARQAPAVLPDLRHLKVLAVDDTAVNREVLAEALAGFRISAVMAESGPEAIEKTREQEFHVIFMDCSMPGMDGFTAAAAIREKERAAGRAPAFIVALTAHVTGPEAARWREAGMDAYVAKPFTIAQLANVLGDRIGTIANQKSGITGAEEAPAAELDAGKDAAPLLAAETLAMFNALSPTKGHALAARVFGLFNAHAPKALASLADGLQSGISTEEAAKLAHALKSMCLSAGAARVASLCGHMEERLKNGNSVADKELAILAAMIDDTRQAMDAYLKVGEGPAEMVAAS